jgi:glyoxylase-like metal-dependent hydrolase (beta-lactamase superfamily II)
VTAYICLTCATQYAPSDAPPDRCEICEDERQYVPESGQRWTSAEELRGTHHNDIRDDAGFDGVGVDPHLAIGQRALLVPFDGGTLMWDCVPFLDDHAAAEIEHRGGLAGIAISHPHYYSGMVEWAERFECPVHLHADDADWIMRPSPAISLWSGETLPLGGGLTLIRCGGHFAGGTVLHVADRRALLSGDIVQVIPDRRFVSFMYSYPNLIPLPEASVRAIVDALEPFEFDTIHGAWWGTLVRSDGSGVVRRSAERYLRALRGEFP